MAPRNRHPKNARLEGTNIKVMNKGGKAYYYYQMPDGTREPLVHSDEAASIEAAHALNRALRPSGKVVDRILAQPVRPTTKNPHLVEVLEQFEREWLPEQNYAESTLQVRRQKLQAYRQEWPHKRIGDLDTFTIAQYLRQFSAESATQHIKVLKPLFRFAASEGYETQRPMADIERRKPEKRKRARHTWEGYQAIYEASPAWLKRAQDAALYSLQRRGDLLAINIEEQVDLKARTLRVLQQKSRNYDQPVHIDIAMGDELYKAVMASVWSGINCPHLVHHRPKWITQASREAKTHPFAVLPDYLSKAYAKVRDEVGVYNHLPRIQRPGFHSIRALGIWLYHKAGYPDEYVMALAGHATQQMKARYIEGHERPAPVRVGAHLSLSAVDLSEVDWETDLSSTLKSLADAQE